MQNLDWNLLRSWNSSLERKMVTIIEEHKCSYSSIRGGSFAELWWRPIFVSELTSENSSNVTGQRCISWEELLFITSTKNMVEKPNGSGKVDRFSPTERSSRGWSRCGQSDWSLCEDWKQKIGICVVKCYKIEKLLIR